jgi:hypothetical protein
MALPRDRNGWNGVVLGDPPQEPGLRYPSDDDDPITETEPPCHHRRRLGPADASAAVGACGHGPGKVCLVCDTTHLTAYVPPDVLLAYGIAWYTKSN